VKGQGQDAKNARLNLQTGREKARFAESETGPSGTRNDSVVFSDGHHRREIRRHHAVRRLRRRVNHRLH
jgi:hypothetical protein